jgi:putative protease
MDGNKMNSATSSKKNVEIKIPELLAPAGSLETLRVAVDFGADAVYIGGDYLGLRAKAKNFSLAEIAIGVRYAHERGVKVYCTANILAHQQDLLDAKDYFISLKELGEDAPDALIISDPGIFSLAREIWPEVEIHISTQANNTNERTFMFWKGLGAKRVVAARELRLDEIREIRDHIPPDMEMECFVHGSMCISYSGRCLLSNFLTGRDANRGFCTHPCRWQYSVMEETREGQHFPVFENERGTFIFNSKDLSMIGHIPQLVEAGIDSFKIEGRMKNALYVATVIGTYRKALDDFFADPALYQANVSRYQAELLKCTYRPTSTGFYLGRPDEQMQIYDESTYHNDTVFLGIVEAIDSIENVDSTEPVDSVVVAKSIENADSLGVVNSSEGIDSLEIEFVDSLEEVGVFDATDSVDGLPSTMLDLAKLFMLRQKNKFCVGDTVEILAPCLNVQSVTVEAIYNAEGIAKESAPHAGEKLYVLLSEQPSPGNILRMPKKAL